MIAAWMLYCIGIGLALTLAAYAAERALYLAGRPTRWAWSGALIGTLFLPIAATVRPQAFRVIPVPLAEPTRAPAAAAAAALPQGTAPSTPVSGRALRLSDFDGVLRWGWGLSSVAALLVLAAAAARLVALRRRWRTALVDGRSVLLADDVGPAVAGLWPPRVVIPAWALNLTQTQRRLMLAHEDEHVRARDPWLLAAGTAALVLAPWNLALWWLSQRLRLAVEMDCDARVLAREGDAPAYGELLLRVGQRRARLPLGAPALSEPASFLGRRIRRMVTALPRWRWAGATAASMLAAAAILAACEAPRPVGPTAESEQSAVMELERGATQHRAPTTPPYWPAYWPGNLRRLAHQYYPEVFARPLPGAAIAFVFDAQDSVIGHATGVREAGDGDCLAVVDRLVPAFRTSSWSLGGCADFANRAVVVSWKVLKQVQGSDAVLTELMVDERPVFLSGPPLEYPDLLRLAGIQGRVTVRAIIDTTGRAEPASVQVVQSPHRGFDQADRNAVLQARIRGGRFRGRPVRVLITFPVNFRIGR